MELGERLKLFAEYIGGVRVLTDKLNDLTAKNNSLYKYINGDQMPGHSLLLPLCLLGLNINWLLTGNGDMLIKQDNTERILPNQDTTILYRNSIDVKSKPDYDIMERKIDKLEKTLEVLLDRVNRSERMPSESSRAVRKGSPKYDTAVFDDELMLKSKKKPVK